MGSWRTLPANKRKRREMSKRGFIARLFAGEESGYTLARAWRQMGGGENRILEVDVKRGEQHDLLKDDGVYSGLIAAAIQGKILAVVGGPNCRSRSVLRHYPIEGNPWAPRPVRRWSDGEFGSPENTRQEQEMVQEDDILLWRMIFVYMVASYAGKARGREIEVFWGWSNQLLRRSTCHRWCHFGIPISGNT